MKWTIIAVVIAAIILAVIGGEVPGLGAVSAGLFVSATMLYIYRDLKSRDGHHSPQADEERDAG